MEKLSKLETRVLNVILRTSVPAHAALLAQVPALAVARRQLTGAGVVTDFVLTDQGVPRATPPSFHVAGVGGTHPESPSGIDFILFIRDGRIAWLESVSFDGVWPSDPDQIELIPR